jgi:flagellar hook-basal body complex protein FliE
MNDYVVAAIEDLQKDVNSIRDAQQTSEYKLEAMLGRIEKLLTSIEFSVQNSESSLSAIANSAQEIKENSEIVMSQYTPVGGARKR